LFEISIQCTPHDSCLSIPISELSSTLIGPHKIILTAIDGFYYLSGCSHQDHSKLHCLGQLVQFKCSYVSTQCWWVHLVSATDLGWYLHVSPVPSHVLFWECF